VLVELFVFFFFGGWIRFFCILFCALLYPPLHAFFPCGIYSARVILYDDIFCIERFLLRTLVPPSSDMVRSGRAPKAKLHTYISSLMISFWLIENGLFFLYQNRVILASHPCIIKAISQNSDMSSHLEWTPGIPSLPFINYRHSAFVLVQKETAIR